MGTGVLNRCTDIYSIIHCGNRGTQQVYWHIVYNSVIFVTANKRKSPTHNNNKIIGREVHSGTKLIKTGREVQGDTKLTKSGREVHSDTKADQDWTRSSR